MQRGPRDHTQERVKVEALDVRSAPTRALHDPPSVKVVLTEERVGANCSTSMAAVPCGMIWTQPGMQHRLVVARVDAR